MTLPLVGNLAYNGITFPVESSTTVDANPIPDPAGRTFSYIVYRIGITCYLTAKSITVPNKPAPQPTDPVDTVLTYIRQQLQAPGGALTFNSKGFGALNVNGASGVKDVAFGPMPKLMRWEPIGGIAAAKVTWTVEVHIPECCTTCGTPVYQGVVMALTYTLDVDVDREGYTTIGINGTLAIPMTRISVGNKTLPDHVDQYFEQSGFFGWIPTDFRRTKSHRTIDESKRIMRFDYQFVEFPQNILPPGVTDCDASQTFQSTAGKMLMGRYVSTMSMTITLDKTRPRWQALDYFLVWVQQRYLKMVEGGATPVPISFEFSEPNVFGRGPTGRFSLSFFVTTSNLQALRAQSALWLQPGWRYQDWQNSMFFSGVQSSRGMAQFKTFPADDVIVDLCQQGPVSPGFNSYQLQVPYQDQPFGFPLVCPPPESSWLYYDNKLLTDGDTGSMTHKLLPEQTATLTTLDPGFESSTPGTQVGAIYGVVSSSGQTDVVQQRTTPQLKVRMVGRALRACYSPVIPSLKYVAGQQVTPTGRPRFGQTQATNLGIPIFHAWWDLEYLLPYNDTTLQAVIGIPYQYGSGNTLRQTQQTQLTNNAQWNGRGFGLDSITPEDLPGDFQNGGAPTP